MRTNIVSYPQRGPYGDAKFRGNTSGYLIKDLIEHFKPKSVMDPMCGSNTTGDVCKEMKIHCDSYDLSMGFNLLESKLKPKKYDMIFLHPPYMGIIKYSDNSNDLSNCKSFDEYIKKLARCIERLAEYLTEKGILVILIGDVRKNGNYFPLGAYVQVLYRKELKAKIIKIQHGTRSNAFAKLYGNIIMIMHEEVLVLSGFTKVTWRALIQRVFDELNADQLSLPEIYHALKNHPKRLTNQTFRATIRRTLQENGRSSQRGLWAWK